jgi:cytosine/uracil/thiamine/allantoin permease
MFVAIAALLGLIAGCCITHFLNRKKNVPLTEDIEALDRMYFLAGFNEGWDKALEAVEKFAADCESISKRDRSQSL